LVVQGAVVNVEAFRVVQNSTAAGTMDIAPSSFASWQTR